MVESVVGLILAIMACAIVVLAFYWERIETWWNLRNRWREMKKEQEAADAEK